MLQNFAPKFLGWNQKQLENLNASHGQPHHLHNYNFWRSKRAIGLLVQKTQLLLKKDHRGSTVVKKKKKVQSLRKETISIRSKEETLSKIPLMASSQTCAWNTDLWNDPHKDWKKNESFIEAIHLQGLEEQSISQRRRDWSTVMWCCANPPLFLDLTTIQNQHVKSKMLPLWSSHRHFLTKFWIPLPLKVQNIALGSKAAWGTSLFPMSMCCLFPM